MISDKMSGAMNGQVNAELYSAYLYLSMSSFFSSINMPGFANWMKVQALEEVSHAMKMYNFVIDRGGRVVLDAIAAPPTEWETALDAFNAVLEHEKKVTGLINDLMNLAVAEKDHATQIFLQWFVTEQIEEEASADEVVQRLTLIGPDGNGIFLFDREMGARAFKMPPDLRVSIVTAPGGGA